MSNILKVGDGLDVAPMMLALSRNPSLWGQYSLRKSMDPHREMTDIWLRYNAIENYSGDLQKFNSMHFPVWYPGWFLMPEFHPVVMGLFHKFNGTHLGGVLITKIPAGGQIAPHTDKGWHAEFYNTKLYVVLAGNARCTNRVMDEYAVMNTGEVWYFNNNVDHDVVNLGDSPRITLIVCMRNE